MAVNADNWNHSHYSQGQWRAQITFGADARNDPNQGTEDLNFLYFVTLLDQDLNGLFQRTFNDLNDAVADLNQRYGHWEFSDGTKIQGEGCGSCQAH